MDNIEIKSRKYELARCMHEEPKKKARIIKEVKRTNRLSLNQFVESFNNKLN